MQIGRHIAITIANTVGFSKVPVKRKRGWKDDMIRSDCRITIKISITPNKTKVFKTLPGEAGKRVLRRIDMIEVKKMMSIPANAHFSRIISSICG